MKLLLTFLLGFIGAKALSQDVWKICLDKKVLLSSSVEDEQKNVTIISSADFAGKKKFIVNYKENPIQKGWQRSILIYDENDQELERRNVKQLDLSVANLKALLNKSRTLKIYTISLPTDPKKQAQVRVRRVHLCTLALQ